MENKKTKRFSRAQLDDKEKIKINDLTNKIKCMSIPDLKQFPLYKGGDGITKYNHGDVIRYKNGSILYVMENQHTFEKVPTLLTVIKDLKIVSDKGDTKCIKPKKNKKKSKKSVKIQSNSTIDVENALNNFEIFYKLFKKNKCIINIKNSNFIGNEFFNETKFLNELYNDGNDSELDYDVDNTNC